jgi:hypothetical protein
VSSFVDYVISEANRETEPRREAGPGLIHSQGKVWSVQGRMEGLRNMLRGYFLGSEVPQINYVAIQC